ncbi:hypothetical protein RHM66_25105 [Pseudomonas sp. RTB3]|nr:hypothetical protein RHM66_25105 [Pseudomonas sp. RTB3]
MTAPAIALLLLAAPNAHARTIVTLPNTSISSTTRVDDYSLNPASSLIAHGAITNQIVMSGAGLTAEAGSRTLDIDARQQSTVVIDGSQVTARSMINQAILVTGNSSLLVTNNSTVTNSTGWGVSVTRTTGE